MKIAIVIPVYNKPQVTHQCLTSLFKYAGENPSFSVIAVDDGSDTMTKHCLKSYPVHLLTNRTNKGYVYSTNRGIRYALDELLASHVVLMNNDIEVSDGWLSRMIRYSKEHDLVGYFGRQYMGSASFKPGYFLEFSCALIKRKVFKKVGLLDRGYPGGYYSDDEFCLQALREGFKVGQIRNRNHRYVDHHTGGTYGKKRNVLIKKAYASFIARWSPYETDPIVKNYLAKYTWDPFKEEWGDLPRALRLHKQYKKKR